MTEHSHVKLHVADGLPGGVLHEKLEQIRAPGAQSSRVALPDHFVATPEWCHTAIVIRFTDRWTASGGIVAFERFAGDGGQLNLADRCFRKPIGVYDIGVERVPAG